MFEPNVEELQAVIINDAILEAVSDLSLIVNDETLGVTIPPLGLYCQKTGAQIGQRTENSLFSIAKIHGKNAIIPALYNSVSLNTAPAWLWTNETHLDKLMVQDPIGYAVYCFGLITAQFYQTQKNTDKKRQPFAERYWAMARSHALLTAKGTAELDALNLELVKILTYMPDTTAYLFRRIRKFAQTPDSLAMLHCTGELIELLREATNRALDSLGRADAYIKRTRFVDYALTPEDAARGPSNVRRQKASKTSVKEATAFAELAKLFEDAGLSVKDTITLNTPGTGAWKEKFAGQQAAKDAEMLEDISNLAGTNWDLGLLEENEETEDNSIEVRQIAIPETVEIVTELEIIVIENREQLEAVFETVEPPKKLTALEMLRAKKVQ